MLISALKYGLTLLVAVSASQAHALYQIDDAINDALGDNLKYVGAFVPRYSEDHAMKMCVYRGKRTVVFMYYCTSKSVGAESLSIHSVDPKTGSVDVYAEVPVGLDASKVTRASYYDLNFSVSARANDGFFFNANLKQFRAYDDAKSKRPSADCLATKVFPKTCKRQFASAVATWAEPAQQFWNEPKMNWYELVRLMKSKVPQL